MKKIIVIALIALGAVSCADDELNLPLQSNPELTTDLIGTLTPVTSQSLPGSWVQVKHFRTDRNQYVVEDGMPNIGRTISISVEANNQGLFGGESFRIVDFNQPFLDRLQFGTFTSPNLTNTSAAYFTKDGLLNVVTPIEGGYIHEVFSK